MLTTIMAAIALLAIVVGYAHDVDADVETHEFTHLDVESLDQTPAYYDV